MMIVLKSLFLLFLLANAVYFNFNQILNNDLALCLLPESLPVQLCLKQL